MKKLLPIIIIIISAAVGLTAIFTANDQAPTISAADSIIAPSDQTGNIPEKILGDPTKATVIVYEYADYGCSHCADWNQVINELLEKYPYQLAVVFRGYNLGFTNGLAVARAATAAQLQGYWKEYKDLLFANQAEWYYTKEDELSSLLNDYFNTASNGAGDLEQFKSDLNSDAVTKRLEFEQSMGSKIHLSGTPTFRIDGKQIELSKLIDTIEAKINS